MRLLTQMLAFCCVLTFMPLGDAAFVGASSSPHESSELERFCHLAVPEIDSLWYGKGQGFVRSENLHAAPFVYDTYWNLRLELSYANRSRLSSYQRDRIGSAFVSQLDAFSVTSASPNANLSNLDFLVELLKTVGVQIKPSSVSSDLALFRVDGQFEVSPGSKPSLSADAMAEQIESVVHAKVNTPDLAAIENSFENLVNGDDISVVQVEQAMLSYQLIKESSVSIRDLGERVNFARYLNRAFETVISAGPSSYTLYELTQLNNGRKSLGESPMLPKTSWFTSTESKGIYQDPQVLFYAYELGYRNPSLLRQMLSFGKTPSGWLQSFAVGSPSNTFEVLHILATCRSISHIAEVKSNVVMWLKNIAGDGGNLSRLGWTPADLLAAVEASKYLRVVPSTSVRRDESRDAVNCSEHPTPTIGLDSGSVFGDCLSVLEQLDVRLSSKQKVFAVEALQAIDERSAIFEKADDNGILGRLLGSGLFLKRSVAWALRERCRNLFCENGTLSNPSPDIVSSTVASAILDFSAEMRANIEGSFETAVGPALQLSTPSFPTVTVDSLYYGCVLLSWQSSAFIPAIF